MSKLIDVSKLGLREVTYREAGARVNEVGMKVMATNIKTRMEAQPLLTKEESMVLVDAEWKPNPRPEPPAGQKFYCMVNFRRFWAEEIPVAKQEEPEVNEPVKPTMATEMDEPTPAEKSAMNRIVEKLSKHKPLTAYEKQVKAKFGLK